MTLNDYMYGVIEDEVLKYANDTGALNEDQSDYAFRCPAYDEYGNEDEYAEYAVQVKCYVRITDYKGDWYQPPERITEYDARVVSITLCRHDGVCIRRIPVKFGGERLIFKGEI